MRAGKRLAKLAEAVAERNRDRDRPQVVVYLPRKDGDTQPLGLVYQSGGTQMVLYEAEQLDSNLG
jgi:hypothetical protein